MSAVPTFRLAAVIVNHGQNDAALAQLRDLHADSPELFARTEWILVQNGGPPLDLSAILGQSSDCVKVLATSNLGYGAAVNAAVRRTTAPAVLALNADLAPTPGFLAEAHRAAERLSASFGPEREALVGFRLLDDDGAQQGSYGSWPTLVGMFCGWLRPRAIRKYWRPGTVRRAVPWATGACLLMRREFLDAEGGFDPRFFMYYEDVDLCKRAWRAGWRVMFDPHPAAKHYLPYHGRALTHRMAKMARRSALAYFWKHRPRWEFWTLAWIMRFECWRRRAEPGWQEVRQVVERTIRAPEEIPTGEP